MFTLPFQLVGRKLSASLWLCEIEGDGKATLSGICPTHNPHCFLRKSILTFPFSDVCFTHRFMWRRRLRCLSESWSTNWARCYGDQSSTFLLLHALDERGERCFYVFI